jgi:hypothetical protein
MYNLANWIRVVQDRNNSEILQIALKSLSFKRGGNVIAYLRSYEFLQEDVAEYLHPSSLQIKALTS